MKYKYEGIDEFEGYNLECNIPKEEWGFGTILECNLYQPESSKREDSCIEEYVRNPDGSYPKLKAVRCGTPNTMET